MDDLKLLDPLLLKTARVAAKLGRQTLGDKVGASVPTIKNLETHREAIDAVRASTLLGILNCYSESGIKLSANRESDGSIAYSVSWRSAPEKLTKLSRRKLKAK